MENYLPNIAKPLQAMQRFNSGRLSLTRAKNVNHYGVFVPCCGCSALDILLQNLSETSKLYLVGMHLSSEFSTVWFLYRCENSPRSVF